MNIQNAINLAMRNKKNLINKAGCYQCFKLFEVQEIKEYTDQGETALCPFCKLDAVIPDNLGNLTEDYLKGIKNYWIG